MTARVTVTVAILCAAGVAAGADWPRFLGPEGSGISSETGIGSDWTNSPPRVIWKTDLGDKGYAGPSVADGLVFVVDHRGAQDIVRALDIETGEEKWRYSYDEASNSNYGFARATPVYDNGRLYTVSREGKVFCLDAARGRKLWGMDMRTAFAGRKPRWGYSGSALIDRNALVLCPGGSNASVVSVNKLTGSVSWRGGGSDVAGYATPVPATIQGRYQYVIFTASKVMGIDPRSGRIYWSVDWKTKYDVNAATPIVIGNNVFVTSNYGKGCGMIAVDRTGARLAWQNRDIQSHFNTPVYADGHIYSTSDPGRLVCMDARSGAVVWSHKGFEKGGLIGIDGKLIVMDGRNGDIVLVDMTPQSYREHGRIRPLGGQSWTAPVVAGGRLIVRNKTMIACLDLGEDE